MAKKIEEVGRDNNSLLNLVYANLISISEEIEKDPTDNKLIDAFDSLLSTYFDIEEDGY